MYITVVHCSPNHHLQRFRHVTKSWRCQNVWQGTEWSAVSEITLFSLTYFPQGLRYPLPSYRNRIISWEMRVGKRRKVWIFKELLSRARQRVRGNTSLSAEQTGWFHEHSLLIRWSRRRRELGTAERSYWPLRGPGQVAHDITPDPSIHCGDERGFSREPWFKLGPWFEGPWGKWRYFLLVKKKEG